MGGCLSVCLSDSGRENDYDDVEVTGTDRPTTQPPTTSGNIKPSAPFESLLLLLLWFYLSILGAATYVLAWKRGIAILTAGNVKVSPDSRMHLSNGYSLQIKDAREQDAGDYICQIATIDPREITHHVEILGLSLHAHVSPFPSSSSPHPHIYPPTAYLNVAVLGCLCLLSLVHAPGIHHGLLKFE